MVLRPETWMACTFSLEIKAFYTEICQLGNLNPPPGGGGGVTPYIRMMGMIVVFFRG